MGGWGLQGLMTLVKLAVYRPMAQVSIYNMYKFKCI